MVIFCSLKKKKSRFAFFFLVSLANPWLGPRIKSLFKKTPVLPMYLLKLVLPLKLYNTETVMLHIRPQSHHDLMFSKKDNFSYLDNLLFWKA